jgi:hypothetical protein
MCNPELCGLVLDQTLELNIGEYETEFKNILGCQSKLVFVEYVRRYEKR